jgi:hypothetical protein
MLGILCLNGLAEKEGRYKNTPSGGFYFPELDTQSADGYVGVFPVKRLSSYYLHGTHRGRLLVGEISATPFVLHSGPDSCGWLGFPGFSWFGCGLHPGLITASPDGLGNSVYLTKGMTKGEVLESLGRPARRVFLGQKEIWEYSGGYSLLFDSDQLKEIR